MTKKYLDSVRQLLSRRRALQGMSAVIGAAVVGCGDDASSEGSGETETGTGGDGDGDGDGDPGDGDPGDGDGDGDPGDGDGDGDPGDGDGDGDGDPDPCAEHQLAAAEALANVDHIIVLMMENRSFDHYFGARQLLEGQTDVEGLTGDESNLNDQAEPIAIWHSQDYEPEDPPHGWDSCHLQWNQGLCDGFVTEHIAAHDASLQTTPMGYHTRDDLPVLYALADEFTLCDHWYCSLLGPTWPNRYYLHCATSNGGTGNTPQLGGPTTIQQICDDAGISNNNYYSDVAWRWGALPALLFAGTEGINGFFDKAASGELEQVVIIDPSFTSNDDHPSHSILLGQALIGMVYQALASSPLWERCLLVITYDEHGGFYDHVPPPTTPDAEGPEFQQQGFRVPTVVVGPHVRKGCVVHTVFDHASFPATVTRKFGLPEINARAAGVADLASCIDPSKIDDPQPPPPLPKKVIIDIDEILAHVGVTTSQEELMRATGNWPITPEFTAAERTRIRRLLERGEKMGVVELRR